MKDKRQITDAIVAGGTKWNAIYDSEEELIQDLLRSDKYEQRYTMGRGYLESFKKQIMNGRTLTPKQMTMLKRLAKEIYKNVHWNMGLTSD